MLTAPTVLLSLKVAVTAVTLLFLSSLVALARGNYRLHGRINLAVFVLTLAALLGLETLARLVEPEMFTRYLKEKGAEGALTVHLTFSVPAALLLPLMLYTGLKGIRRLHVALAVLFSVLWAGTFVTGVFFLPHAPP